MSNNKSNNKDKDFNNVTRYTAEAYEDGLFGGFSVSFNVDQSHGDLVRYEDYKALLDAYNRVTKKKTT